MSKSPSNTKPTNKGLAERKRIDSNCGALADLLLTVTDYDSDVEVDFIDSNRYRVRIKMLWSRGITQASFVIELTDVVVRASEELLSGLELLIAHLSSGKKSSLYVTEVVDPPHVSVFKDFRKVFMSIFSTRKTKNEVERTLLKATMISYR